MPRTKRYAATTELASPALSMSIGHCQSENDQFNSAKNIVCWNSKITLSAHGHSPKIVVFLLIIVYRAQTRRLRWSCNFHQKSPCLRHLMHFHCTMHIYVTGTVPVLLYPGYSWWVIHLIKDWFVHTGGRSGQPEGFSGSWLMTTFFFPCCSSHLSITSVKVDPINIHKTMCYVTDKWYNFVKNCRPFWDDGETRELRLLTSNWKKKALLHVWFHCVSVVIWNVIFMTLICSLDISWECLLTRTPCMH